MKAPNLHLNLLHASERQSSSPVRLRVMLPIFAALACVGCLVWWGVLAGQLMLVKAQSASIEKDLAAKKAEHGGILGQKSDERNMQSELDQLTMYARGRRTYGDLFRQFANVVPEGVQLMALEIPEPPAQILLPPGAKPGQTDAEKRQLPSDFINPMAPPGSTFLWPNPHSVAALFAALGSHAPISVISRL